MRWATTRVRKVGRDEGDGGFKIRTALGDGDEPETERAADKNKVTCLPVCNCTDKEWPGGRAGQAQWQSPVAEPSQRCPQGLVGSNY